MSSGWTTERIAEQFRTDVLERFEHENAEWLAEENTSAINIKAEYDAKGAPYPDWLTTDRNSFFWEIYTASEITIVNNSVDILLPQGFAIYTDFIAMFDDTSTGWSRPSVEAKLVDGEARLSVHLILIDYWDDKRHAEWLAKKVQIT